MDEVYDVIVLGTGLTECILSGLLSVDGKKVLHMDRNDYYGGASASLNLTQLYRKFREGMDPPAILGRDRDYNVDLIPKFAMASGEFTNILYHTDVTRYLEFRQIAGSYVYRDGKISKVPSNNTEAVSSPLMGWFEKGRAKSFFEFIQNYNFENPTTHQGLDLNTVPMTAVYKKFGLEPGTQDFIGHALALHLDDEYMNRPARETYEKICLYMNSMARYGWVFLNFAHSLSAIYGGTYMLEKKIEEIVYENGKVVGVKSDGEVAKAKLVIGDPSYFPDKVKKVGQVVRVICFLNHPIPNTSDSDSVQIVIPQNQVKRQHGLFGLLVQRIANVSSLDIYIANVSNAHSVAAPNFHVAIVSTIVETATPERECDAGIALLGQVLEKFVAVEDIFEPTADGTADQVFISKSYDATSHFETVCQDVKDIYKRVTGNELKLEGKVQRLEGEQLVSDFLLAKCILRSLEQGLQGFPSLVSAYKTVTKSPFLNHRPALEQNIPAHPTKTHLQPYFAAFAEKTGITKITRFSAKVVSIEERVDGEKGWTLVIEDLCSRQVSKESFEFVVNAQGSFSTGAVIPEIKGSETFHGELLHSSQLRDENILAVGNVVIVGFGRSALDFSVTSASTRRDHGQTHLVARTARWGIPSYILGIYFDNLLFNRMTTIMMPAWFHLPFEAGLHKKADLTGNYDPVGNVGVVVKSFWSFIEWAVTTSHGLRSNNVLRPKHSILHDLRSQIPLMPAEFYPMAKSKKIQVHTEAVISQLNGSDVHLSNGTVIENVDTLVFATGYDMKQSILLPESKKYLLESDGLYLYRHLVHPKIENMAFVGKNHSLMTIPIAEMSSQWITAALRGDLKLPSKEVQLASIDALRHWKRSNLRANSCRSIDVSTRFQQYLDELCVDLGVTPFRKFKRLGGWWNPFGWIFELLGACGPKDYEFGMVRRELEAIRKKREE
ncbi:UNVERIFIED_CONTAM: Rab GDP dissociation inhibitor alpha [Siphonaria sp. JEL0065]|nr:Rab GDP dissociation inhibitor alpha [Siphonaria sp. JEL0065]